MDAYNNVIGNVARIVDRRTALSDQGILGCTYATQFAVARQRELDMLDKHDVFGEEMTVAEIQRKHPEALLVSSHFLYTIKDVEASSVKYKADWGSKWRPWIWTPHTSTLRYKERPPSFVCQTNVKEEVVL
eukprot:Lankesteria_metandrocarpae@DN10455_c0_g1_i1.p4